MLAFSFLFLFAFTFVNKIPNFRNCCRKKSIEAFEHGETPWRSIWLSYLIQMLTGIQFSIYFTSMWPYFTTVCISAHATVQLSSDRLQKTTVASPSSFHSLVLPYICVFVSQSLHSTSPAFFAPDKIIMSRKSSIN